METNGGRYLSKEQQTTIQESEKILSDAAAKAREKLSRVGLDPEEEPFGKCNVGSPRHCQEFQPKFSNPLICRRVGCGHPWSDHLPR